VSSRAYGGRSPSARARPPGGLDPDRSGRAALQLREVEPAGGYSEGLVRLTQQCSGLFVKTLRTPDSELAPFAAVAAVKHPRQRATAAA
jgi:hypothetical protein